MDQRLEAARAEGRAHGLRGHAHCGNNYDDMEEARCYHEGYKRGLDECYGQMPIQGYVGEESDHDVVDTMASYGAEGLEEADERKAADQYSPSMHERIKNATPEELSDMAYNFGGDGIHAEGELKLLMQAQKELRGEMDEGNAFTAALARTPKGGKFSVGGHSYTDTSSYDSHAFESLDRQLNALLNEDSVSEGMTVSISKGQQGSPDSVSINASDAEADSLLSFVKQAGLGIFGGDDHQHTQDAMITSEPSTASSGAIEVVDDHDGMLSLIRKMAGQGAAHDHSSEDYADEENCNECGMAYESCGCDESAEMVDEMQTPYQLMANVAEDTPVQANADEVEETGDEEQANAEINAAASNTGGATNEDDSMDDEEEEEEGGYDAEGNQQFGGPYDAAGHYVGGYRGYDDRRKDRELNEWANSPQRSSHDEQFETDIEFMTDTITSGLNKKKIRVGSGGQTTVPVVAAVTTNESTDLLSQWKKLSGI